ncbi:GumC family protein [Paracoccus sp. (in: a-proteobacteria)]|uniref:GumC family protein n=1 Tax=Paracoccus sp. TaxID=267 RepID=UPI003A8B40C0
MNLSIPRVLRLKTARRRVALGGRRSVSGRPWRYGILFGVGTAGIWVAILAYLLLAPLRYTSEVSLILPGAGASASVNLDQIGQASSYANSPYANSSVSPTETYKRLLGADRILRAASGEMGMKRVEFGEPRIELVDQTGLINLAMTGVSPEDAQARGKALLHAFFKEVNALRSDEIAQRQDSDSSAIEDYRRRVMATRARISQLRLETGLVSVDQYHQLVADSEALARTVRDMRARIADKDNSISVMVSVLGIDARLAAAALRLHADPEFTSLTVELSQRAANLSEARASYGAQHPEVRSAEARYHEARRRVVLRGQRVTGLPSTTVQRLDFSQSSDREALLSDLVRLDTERAGLVAETEALSQDFEKAEKRKLDLIEPAAKLEDLQRDFSVAEAVFASASARNQTSRTDLFASYPLVQVLQDPSFPVDPSSPRKTMAIAAGAAATLSLTIGLFLGWIRRPLIAHILADRHLPDGAGVTT